MFINYRNRQESGIVLVTVLMMSVIMMILAIGIIGTNVSGVTSGQRQIDRIKSEQLTKGAYWIAYSQLSANPPVAPTYTTVTLDGKTFTATVSGAGAGIGGSTQSRSVTVNY